MPTNVIDFFVNNWDMILFIIAIIVVMIVSIKKGENTILKQIVFSLVTKAEQEFGAGLGVLKYAVVADMLYQRIPNLLKLLYSSKDIEKLIESTLAEAKAKWEKSKNLQEYIEKPNTLAVDIKDTVTSITEEAIKTAVENGATKAVEMAKTALDPFIEKTDEASDMMDIESE